MARLLALIIISLMLVGAGSAQSDLPVKKSPSITLKDLNGRAVSLSRYKGKVVLVNFWATWCPPCRMEIPELIKWQKDYQNQGLQIIGVTYPPTKLANVRAFVGKNKINYPILLGTKQTKALFQPGETLPITIVIDKTGDIVEIIEGILYPEEFDEKIKSLLDSAKLRLRSNKNQ